MVPAHDRVDNDRGSGMALTRRTLAWLVPAVPLVAAGCQTPPDFRTEASTDVVRSLNRYTRDYLLQPGDQIEVSVFRVPDASRTVTIRSDGRVSLPIVRDIQAAGRSIPELTAELELSMAARLINPEVSINVLNPRDARVYVLGEVARPGPIPFRTVATAAQAIADAGGITRSGSQTQVALVRLENDGFLTGRALKSIDSGDTAFYVALQQMVLQPGDLVIVPESGRAQFVRGLSDFVTTPLGALNQVLAPYYQFKLLSLIQR